MRPVQGHFLERVRDTLRKADGTLEKELSKAFGGSGGGIVNALKWKVYRFLRSNALQNKMNNVETQVKEASNELLHLISILANALKLDSVNVSESAKEEFRPLFARRLFLTRFT